MYSVRPGMSGACDFQKGELNMESKSILLAGVGGQGAILTAKILVTGLMEA